MNRLFGAVYNTVVIFPGPNVGALPAGCHERCNPDTLCLPPLPDIVSWQWYFDGNPIPGATSNQFAATQSGTYYAELLDVNGCQAEPDLTLDLYDDLGTYSATYGRMSTTTASLMRPIRWWPLFRFSCGKTAAR
ncbi:MAG: hypothetical protein R2778_07290 [Saprospiraceae bacterium]